MKQISLRVLALLLALCALLVFTACGEDGPEETTPGETVGGESGWWEDTDYDGTVINYMQNIELYRDLEEAGAASPLLFSKGPDEDISDNAVYAEVLKRNNVVEERLGIEIHYMTTTFDRDASSIINTLEGYVLLGNDETAPDIVSHICSPMRTAAVRGLLYNVYDTEEENHFDFTDEGWYTEMMESMSWREGEAYVLCGDYFIDILRASTPLLVNLELFEELFYDIDGVAHLYNLVEGGCWTLDTLYELADAAYLPAVPGTIDYAADRFGLITNSYSAEVFLLSAGISPIEEQNGRRAYVGAEGVSKISDGIDKLLTMQAKDGISFDYDISVKPSKGCIHHFANGGSLFAHGELACLEGSLLQGSDSIVGAVPHPQYTQSSTPETPEYKTHVGVANVGGILLNSTDFSACTALLQLMTEESDSVMHMYFEVGLKYKNNKEQSPEQIRMLELIREGLYFFVEPDLTTLPSPIPTFQNMVRWSLIEQGTNQFTSDWRASETQRNTAMDEMYE